MADSCRMAAAALTTGTSAGEIWLQRSARARRDRSTAATKVRFRLSRAATSAAFSRLRPSRTRATRVRTYPALVTARMAAAFRPTCTTS